MMMRRGNRRRGIRYEWHRYGRLCCIEEINCGFGKNCGFTMVMKDHWWMIWTG